MGYEKKINPWYHNDAVDFFKLEISFLIIGKNQIENHKKLFKNNIAKASLDGIFTELYYETNHGISFNEVKDSGHIVLKDFIELMRAMTNHVALLKSLRMDSFSYVIRQSFDNVPLKNN